MKRRKSGGSRRFEISVVAPAALVLFLAGCGTALNSPSPSSAGTTQAQSQPPSGPMLGYVWDASSQSLRPIQGVPGASVIGSAIVSAPSSGPGFIATATSSVSGMALFLDAHGGVFQSPLVGGQLTKVASVPGAASIVLSNSGNYALVTGKGNSGVGNASVISGLPQSPSIRALNLSGLASILGGVASDTGTVALAAGSGQGAVSIVAFANQGAGTQVATVQAFGGLQFVPNSDELVVADGASGALTAISHVNTTPSSEALSPAGGITAPVALDITPNGRWVVAANQGGDVLRIDLTGVAAATNVHCSCAPSQVLALTGSSAGSSVRLVTTGGGPLWIVDAGASAPKAQFVPAIPLTSVSTITTRSTM